MNTVLKLLFVCALAFVFTGCASRKPTVAAAVKTAESEILHKQAVKALEDRSFFIKATGGFYFPDGQLKHSPRSYISMQGKQAVIRFAPKLRDRTAEGNWIEDGAAEITKEQGLKNGDMQFRMKVKGNESWMKYGVLITLYKNTNQCYVQVLDIFTGPVYFAFKGEILSND